MINNEIEIVYSNRFRPHVKAILDEVLRIYGTARAYKEKVWGRELEREEVLKIT